MDDLVTWLRAQLDDDERVAKRAGAHHPTWTYDRETFTVSSFGDGGWSIAARKDDGSPINDVDGEHIARHDPARVLAEVDAKRRILDRYAELRSDVLDALNRDEPDEAPTATEFAYEQVCQLLALPYADREGYRDEWRPA